ncbi:LLM class flavin-dependent oxidoreductase [Novosphingobium bradum]|uniref:LLM class flavin-dependent oxidoreductase n=1 Tax=Novosphingobium bradum TaxID=1737444 RepID=A0ABV7IR80_9SPHN
MIPLSVLDLVSVREGWSLGQALAEAPRVARVAEEAGYRRYWVAEHHGMPGIAGAATSVVLAHVGNATSRIRLGAGGIMLPNHNPFVIAEQFGALDALFPGRIDLGLGRAPGADARVAQMLHKDIAQASQYFPQDVVELAALFDGDPRLPLQATPGQGAAVEMWVLGSSLFGASLAARLGLPHAFASHFSPEQVDAALRLYREGFQPSARLAKPHAMVGMTVICAETDEEARFLASSQEQGFIALRNGTPGKMKPPIAGFRESLPPHLLAGLDHRRAASAIGSPETVRRAITAFVERTGADEVIVTGAVHDPEAHHRSLMLTMDALA